jgi:uncharacterized protein YdeI (YjbR/CyaY-like superfamily)
MSYQERWAEELSLLKSILDKTELLTVKKWGIDIYTHNGKNIVGFLGFKNHFALWFYNGVFLTDKYKVLVSADGEKTKAMRQWRFTSIDQIDEKKILEYVKETVQNSINGIELKPDKFTPVAVPALLAARLKSDKEFNVAFKKLTPGKQKEYNLYVEEAKQDATKMKRIEKIVPLVLQGIGLNDKYKK